MKLRLVGRAAGEHLADMTITRRMVVIAGAFALAALFWPDTALAQRWMTALVPSGSLQSADVNGDGLPDPFLTATGAVAAVPGVVCRTNPFLVAAPGRFACNLFDDTGFCRSWPFDDGFSLFPVVVYITTC